MRHFPQLRIEYRQYIANKIRDSWSYPAEGHSVCLPMVAGEHLCLKRTSLRPGYKLWYASDVFIFPFSLSLARGEVTVLHPQLIPNQRRGFDDYTNDVGKPPSLMFLLRRVGYTNSFTTASSGRTTDFTTMIIGSGYYAGKALYWLGSRGAEA